uniref:DNA-directed RNA polymerase n=1 Tax=Panthera leo TaxID=9689 RepID=A0A8C8WS18_PANLE
MSALRWGRGASGLRRALWPAGPPGPLAEEGALSGVWGRRRSLSASPCEQDRRKDWGHAELLEVLEARLRQLQAARVSEVTVRRPRPARLPDAGGFQPRRKAQKGGEGTAPGLGGHWAQKLDQEKWAMQRRKQRLQAKLQVRAQQLACEHRLRMVPQLLSAPLAERLLRWEQETPRSPWEEQLARLLREAPRRLSCEAERAHEAGGAPARLETQQQRLLAFLECCLLSGHLPLAHHVLVTCHGKWRQRRVLTLAAYNTVMLGWARKGSFKELVYVFFMVKDAGLTPDLLSYAAALQCMGRLDQDARTVQRCLDQMAQDGLRLQDLFSSVPLCQEEQAALLQAVHKAQPTFSPPLQPQPEPQVNTSPLLREIYAKVRGLRCCPGPPHASASVSAHRCWLLLQVGPHGLVAGGGGGQLVGPCSPPPPGLLQVLPQEGESLPLLASSWAWQGLQSGTLVQKRAGLRPPAPDPLPCPQVAVPCLPRQYWETLGAPEVPHEQPWPLPVLVQLGKRLAEMLVEVVRMPGSLAAPQGSCSLIPVLYHVYSFRSFRQIGILKPHPAFTQLLATAAEHTLTFEAAEVPMLCPPLPWTSPHTGAFLLSPTKLVRSVEGTTQHQRLLDSCPPAELHGALDALTQLGNCAWRVNGRVLDLVLELFAAKGCPRLGVPAPPSEAPRPPEGRLPPDASPAQKAELRRELARCLKVAREMHSLRSDALYRLSLAQHLRHCVFWLPHNMDFRGRTYPCPPHFNHLGSDLARALLEFAQGRPLGPRGLDWLKIHLVNLTGLKKREPLQARLVFADEVMEDVLDSADRPMTGRKWWMEVEEPWQALACCMEIARAVRAPDPAAYISHFPVHQDGSCNGLQHYAALGRDSIGAASVNLLPSDVPQDVYSGVAAQVEVFRRQDAKRGVRVAQVLEGFISRKVVKQTVMTVVYGVTRYGGRLQIERRLRELSDFPQEFVWEASHYLVRQVFNSLQEMFSGTRAIQHWLTESARLIAHSGSAVEWVTPLGIPIIQPYHRDSKVMISGGIQSLTFSHSGDTSQRPNTLKQKNGFPPNFIHSLDSSHMMLTALHCYRKGLTFVSVHDCFWTHAADVEVMNQVCREQFVRLHSQPILHNLSRFLMKRFCSGSTRTGKLQDTLRSVPKTGRARHPARFLRAGGAGGVAQGPAARSPPGPLLHRGLRPEAGEALHLLLQLTLPRRPPCTIV